MLSRNKTQYNLKPPVLCFIISDYTEGQFMDENNPRRLFMINKQAPRICLNKTNYIQIKPAEPFPNTQSIP